MVRFGYRLTKRNSRYLDQFEKMYEKEHVHVTKGQRQGKEKHIKTS